MDPVNLLVGLNLFVSLSANWSAAKKGFKGAITGVKERPKTYLQKTPPNISALVLVLVILGVFNLGTLEEPYSSDFQLVRFTGLIIFLVFSWLQVLSFKSLGENYSQEIVIKKGQELVKTGFYRSIRHPQYLCQILSDLGAGIALLSYFALPVVILLEIPLFVLRASFEDKLLMKHFKDDFVEYKKRSGFILPFIG